MKDARHYGASRDSAVCITLQTTEYEPAGSLALSPRVTKGKTHVLLLFLLLLLLLQLGDWTGMRKRHGIPHFSACIVLECPEETMISRVRLPSH